MDIILYNGNIKTMDNGKCAEAIAMDGGIIKAVGSNDEVMALKTATTQIIDLMGKTLIPGFNDSHMHLTGYANELNSVNLNGTKSVEEIISRIKNFIEENNIAEGRPVKASGWNQNFFANKKNPDKFDLDKISDKHIIITERACHHVYAVNSFALKHFGITKDTPDLEDGEIGRDETGEPDGLFYENARSLVRNETPMNTGAIENLILKAAPNLAKMGITSVHTDDFTLLTPFDAVHEAYTNLAENKKLTFRANEQCRAIGLESYKKVVAMENSADNIKPYYKLGPVKIMADGSLGARTALMKEDYADAPGIKGIPIYSQDELDNIVKLAHNSGRPVAVHAIGDGAMEMAINAIKAAQAENPKENMRHGIVHCQITDKNMLEEFKANEIMALIQPIFIHADWEIAPRRVGEEKSSTSYAFKTLRNMGVKTPFGTDCPVESFNPFNNIYCAVTRKDLNAKPENGFNPNEALSVEEAVYCYTAEPAYASFEEDLKGKLKVGMFADMALLSKDIFTVTHEEILTTEVEMTIFDGKIVYKK
ncbi:amidohydrolase [Tyzzerella sp. OttesenSCG-928-J15]|nr:amidohydrolase [Tyzzerella sp. OttesenSCG-928-J15]